MRWSHLWVVSCLILTGCPDGGGGNEPVSDAAGDTEEMVDTRGAMDTAADDTESVDTAESDTAMGDDTRADTGSEADTGDTPADSAGGDTAADTEPEDDGSEMGGVPVEECSNPGAGWIWCDDFEQDRLDSYFEYDKGDGSLVRENGVGREGSHGMEATFDQGQTDAGSLRLAFGQTPSSYFEPVDDGSETYREIYWRLYLRHDADWQGGGGDKLARATVFANGDWAQAMIAHLWSGGDDPGWNYLVADPASGTDEAGNVQTTKYNDFDNLRWLGAERGETPLFDSEHVGTWYCIEAHVRLNDPGSENGVFEFWIDGEREARMEGMNWVGDYTDYGLNAVFLENYWNDGSPVEQSRAIDNFVVSTERIGCGE